MSDVRITWLDVFATGPLTGNPLAVVWGADGWQDAQMEALAGELNLRSPRAGPSRGPGRRPRSGAPACRS